MSSGGLRSPVFVLVAATAIIFISYGIRQSFGLYTDVISVDLGWGRGSYSFAIATQNLMLGLFAPFLGALADRLWGPAKTIMTAALFYGAGVFLMSQSTSPEAMLGSAGFLAGLGLAGVGLPMLLAIVGQVAPEKSRSTWLGIVTAGGTAGQMVVVPLSQGLIDTFGWATALLVMSIAIGFIVPLAASLAPASANLDRKSGQSLGNALTEARTHWGYILLITGFFVCGLQVQFIATHLPAFLKDNGADGYLAATAISVIGLFNMIGTWVAGWLGGKFRKKYLLSVIYFGRSLAILVFVFLPINEVTVIGFAAVMGLLWLSTVPLTSGIVAQVFGTRYMATLYGIVFLSHQLGSFAGVWVGGLVYDATGSYEMFWWVAIIAGLAAALIHWPINDQPVERLAAEAAR